MAPQLNCYMISNKNHFFCYSIFTILVYVYHEQTKNWIHL